MVEPGTEGPKAEGAAEVELRKRLDATIAERAGERWRAMLSMVMTGISATIAMNKDALVRILVVDPRDVPHVRDALGRYVSPANATRVTIDAYEGFPILAFETSPTTFAVVPGQGDVL